MEPVNAAKHDVWRLFVAIELPDEVKQRALHFRQGLESHGWHARWVRPEAMHLTLRFYGDRRVDSVDDLIAALHVAVADLPSFELRTSGPGVFPNPKRPRVIWLGVEDRSGTLQGMAAAIEGQSRLIGIEPEARPFRPHITIGRIRPEDSGSITAVEARLESLSRFEPIRVSIDQAVLIRSDLRREGPIYTAVERFMLKDGS